MLEECILHQVIQFRICKRKMLKGVCSIDGLKMAEFGDGKLIEDK